MSNPTAPCARSPSERIFVIITFSRYGTSSDCAFATSASRSDSPVWSPANAVRRNDCAPKYRWSISPSSVRENSIPHSSSSRSRSGICFVTVSTLSGSLTKCPSLSVSAAWIAQSSSGSCVPRAPFIPPRAHVVCASPCPRFPSTKTSSIPCSASSIAVRAPAAPAPMTSTETSTRSCSGVESVLAPAPPILSIPNICVEHV